MNRTTLAAWTSAGRLALLGAIAAGAAGCKFASAPASPSSARHDAAASASRAAGSGAPAAGSTGDPSGARSTGSGGTHPATGGVRGSANAGPGSDAGNRASDAATAPDAAASTASTYLYASGYGGKISVFRFDTASGQASGRVDVSASMSPSYLAFAPDKRHAYAINEADAPNSFVIAYSIDPSSGQLRELNRAATGGSGAPHLAVHPSGRFIAVTHYTSGHTSVMPIAADGSVSAPSDAKQGPNGSTETGAAVALVLHGTHVSRAREAAARPRWQLLVPARSGPPQPARSPEYPQ